ncbi:hypothetical protein pb186bvf_003868 [Paramecium bursaria]
MKLILFILISISLAQNWQQIAKSEIGKTIIQTIQISLRQDASFEQIRQSLTQLKNDILADQQSEQSVLEERQQQCDSQSASAQEVVTIAQGRKAAQEEKLPLIKSELADKQEQLAAKSGEEGRNYDRITGLTSQRNQVRQAYNARRDELIQLVGVLEEAKQLLQTIKSFAQKEQILVQIKNSITYFQKIIPEKGSYHALISILLTQMHSNVSQEGVQKVTSIIDALVDSIFQVQKQETISDDQNEADYQKQKARFEFANQRLAASIASLQADVFQLQVRQTETQNEITAQGQTIQIKSQELKDWQQTCSDAQISYNIVNDNLNEQIKIIDEVLTLLDGKEVEETVELIQNIRI